MPKAPSQGLEIHEVIGSSKYTSTIIAACSPHFLHMIDLNNRHYAHDIACEKQRQNHRSIPVGTFS